MGAAFEVDATELLALQEAFKKLGPTAIKEARDATNRVGRWMRSELQGAGKGSGDKLSAHVASRGIKYSRAQVFKGRDGVIRASKFTGGYVPVITLGVPNTLPVSRAATQKNPHPTALDVYAGTEWGTDRPFAQGGQRFRKRNLKGYWFFPEWNRISDLAADSWSSSMDRILRSWGAGG